MHRLTARESMYHIPFIVVFQPSADKDDNQQPGDLAHFLLVGPLEAAFLTESKIEHHRSLGLAQRKGQTVFHSSLIIEKTLKLQPLEPNSLNIVAPSFHCFLHGTRDQKNNHWHVEY
jgi:hypothetical protein